jgi:hypothetical protein
VRKTKIYIHEKEANKPASEKIKFFKEHHVAYDRLCHTEKINQLHIVQRTG